MKKLAAFALALCVVCSALPVSAATHDGHKKHHKVHTKAHHMKTKAHKMHTKAAKKGAHIKAMPKTGMGGASD
ncbi:hypothetical protein [Brevibacillus choshinensis]|uniref:Pentapeptide MXKDX repeat protein n=1 Tax=Brevibacillus choshinensis TaxID=54911 RepID=A0ABR5ND97_BRECH|nr:hypothetical protein [Brevibacillus choshinensis]KQL49361.1 hypothetical protein AN963_06260 [Brevibacillus choshinensis]MED4581338.1 hypothetical protein [Brevibacillus choshinensis]MED4750994.1 hypothetical protein [Brevibacillus choshinensis]MED4783124.1 hypothetical protein [Brevibacillus choshinensis]